MKYFQNNQWALILGGSSGFGLATAKKLSSSGMSVFVVHRDRKGAMQRINEQFDLIKQNGNPFVSMNEDALSAEGQTSVINALAKNMKMNNGSLRALMHSIAYGNLKPIAPLAINSLKSSPIAALAKRLNLDVTQLEKEINEVFSENESEFYPLIKSQYGEALIEDEDMANTIYSMGTSMLTWVQKLFQNKLFAKDARILGMTSEGNTVAWRGYAAVSCAKVALEAVSRAIAVEFAPYGIRSNIIQAGVTDTPALRLIPGSARMKASAELRNPFHRLTTPEDVAGVVATLCMDESAWINGSVIRVDGGEHISAL